MSCRSDPSPPSSGSNPTTSPSTTTPQCPPTACPAMEIEINDTPAANDDLVQLKCEHPVHRTLVNCRIRATSACPNPSTVVLTNPDGRLRFPNAADTTRTLTVPGDGSWVSFQISGETGSNAIGDAVIQAHCNTATGDLKATKAVTVFWFDQAQINITPGSNYSMVGGRYTATPGTGVNYSAQARIRPAGVDCTAPQVTNLRVGIMQNARAGISRRKTWNTPAIAWAAGVAPGTTVTVPTTMRLTITRPILANDVLTGADPLYDRPGIGDPNSLNPPMGCAGGAAATSSDTPGTPAPPTFTTPAVTPAGVTVGTVTYSLVGVRLTSSFITWAAIFDTVTNHACALRERTWDIDVDSTAAGPQRCTAAAADSAPTMTPVIGPPFSNTLSNDPANQTTAGVGAATTTFTK